MFVSYDTFEFGVQLKKIRSSMKLTQESIMKITGINVDTLRKIENGHVIPRFETLEILSTVYKKNLLLILDECKSSNILQTLYNDLDYQITHHNSEAIRDINEKYTLMKLNSYNLVDQLELCQFETFIKGLNQSYSESSSKLVESRDLLISTIKMRHKEFDFYNFISYTYSFIELRSLFLLSCILRELNEFQLSNDICLFLLTQFDITHHSKKYEMYVIVRVYCNLSYNCHLLGNHENALEFSNDGINLCISNDIMHWLHFLYYRRGIAQFNLNQTEYKKSLTNSISLLDIQCLDELKSIYESSLQDLYKINIL